MRGWRWCRSKPPPRRRGGPLTRPKPTFALGFLTGQEMEWLPEAMRILRDQLPNIEVSVSSQYSPDLAQALLRGKLDLAFMRPEAQMPDLDYTIIVKNRLSSPCRPIIGWRRRTPSRYGRLRVRTSSACRTRPPRSAVIHR